MSDCWPWEGFCDPKGYGRRGPRLAHRIAYEAFVGRIPKGKEIDHLCGNRGCVNPWHLEAVAHIENIRRGRNARKTHCLRGHLLPPPNRWGHRNCQPCDTIRHRLAYEGR